MKSFTMVMLASAALALPALAEQRHEGQMSRNQYPQQDWTRQDWGSSGEQTSQMRQRIQAENLSSNQIRKIQRALKNAGHDVGNVDGKWGPNTRQALKDFQEDKGMAATGRLNRRVIGALGFDPERFAADGGNYFGYGGRGPRPR